jgi:hypothetical protein
MVFMKTREKLSPLAKDILDQIQNSHATRDGKGITVIHGYPSNNEGIACVFSLGGGTTVGYKRDEFAVALSELIEASLIFELDHAQNQTRYKLIES